MWYIEIAETHLIKLEFIDFNTRSNLGGISSDNVLVYDGDLHEKLLLNHSGNSIPPPIISSSNKLLVSFDVGDREIRAKGFIANYTTVNFHCFEIFKLHVTIQMLCGLFY